MKSLNVIRIIVSMTFCFIFFSTSQILFAQENLLVNGNFNMLNEEAGEKTKLVVEKKGDRLSNYSAAINWPTWTQPPGAYTNDEYPTFVETEWMESTHPSGGKMLRVNTRGVDAGIFQRFMEVGAGPEEATACIWIYVVRGQVDIGLGNGGASGQPGVRVFQKNKWMRVQIPNSSSPVNQIGIISCWDCPGGAEFYVQSAIVTEYPIEEACCQPE